MKVIELNDENFSEMINSGKTVLVDFRASWCMPCKMQEPILSEFAEEIDDNCVAATIDVDENLETAGLYSVLSIPTIICFKNGEETERSVGVTQKDELIKMIESVKV